MCKYDRLLIVGTYMCNSNSEGIYVYGLNSDTMQVKLNYIERQAADPSSFVYLQERKLLVVANERHDAPYFSSFRVDLEVGELEFISKAEVPGSGTCHVSISPDGKWVVGANYDSGSLVWVQMKENGEFIGPVRTIWYDEKSINKERQDHSYLHGTAFVGNQLFVMNLGGDCVYRYNLNSEDGILTPCKEQSVIWTEKGEGPRYLFVHPNGKWVYLLTEMGNNIIQYGIQEDNKLKELSKVTLLPEKCEIECRASVMQLSPDGSCLFAAVRDYDAIVRFKIDSQTGVLSERRFWPSHGEHPRTFFFSPDGGFIMICNQFSDAVTMCKFNQETNEIGEVVKSLKVPGCSYLGIVGK